MHYSQVEKKTTNTLFGVMPRTWKSLANKW